MNLEALMLERIGSLDADQRLVLDHQHPRCPAPASFTSAFHRALADLLDSGWTHNVLPPRRAHGARVPFLDAPKARVSLSR